MGITDLLLLDCTSGASVTSVSTGNVLGVSAMIPEIDFLVVELSEIEIVLESLDDCVCFSDTVRSLKDAISSFEEQFCTDFSEKSVFGGAFLVELLHSLKANVSEMLEESI